MRIRRLVGTYLLAVVLAVATLAVGVVSPAAAATSCYDQGFEPANNSPGNAVYLTPFFGSASERLAFCTPNDRDWFSIRVDARTTFTISTSKLAGGADTRLDLFAEDTTTLLARNDNDGAGPQSRITYTATRTATYYLRVQNVPSNASGTAMTYDATVQDVCTDTAEPDNTPAQARAVALGAVTHHAICTPRDQDWVRFDAVAGTRYIIETYNFGSSGPNTVLHLMAADGTTELASNDNNGPTLTSLIDYTATGTGPLYAWVQDFSDFAGDPSRTYDLRVAPFTGLLRNPGFENDANGDLAPDNWEVTSKLMKFTRVAGVATAGNFAGRHQAANDSSWMATQVVLVTAGTAYTFAGQVNVPPTADTSFAFRAQIRFVDAQAQTVGAVQTVGTFTVPTAGWVPFSGTRTAPAGAVRAEIRQSVTSLNGTVYVDGFSFNPAA